MPYNSPISSEAPRVSIGLDRVLESLRDAFNDLEWLEGKVFLRAYTDTFPSADGDTNITSPQVYIGNGEYYDASINDHLSCAMFFQSKGSERITYLKPRDRRTIIHERTLVMVFWANLQSLAEDFSADYIYTEAIKPLLMNRIAKNKYVMSIDEYTDEPMQSVFEGFSFIDDRQYNKWPFAGIRIEFKVQYDSSVDPC